MTYVFTIEDRKRSPHFGKEVMKAATILETPPILVCGMRTYTKTPYGLQNISEAWMKEPPAILDRTLVLPENFNTEAMLEKIQQNLNVTSAIRVITATQPSQTSLSKKKPETSEIQIGGGTIQQQFEYAKQLIGKTVAPEEVFKDGQYIDIGGVTVGKGFQGPVKRWISSSRPRLVGPKATSWATVGAMIWSSGFWKTMPTNLRTSRMFSFVMGSPRTRTAPEVGLRMPLKCLKRVLFPAPFDPITAILVLRGAMKWMCCSALTLSG